MENKDEGRERSDNELWVTVQRGGGGAARLYLTWYSLQTSDESDTFIYKNLSCTLWRMLCTDKKGLVENISLEYPSKCGEWRQRDSH